MESLLEIKKDIEKDKNLPLQESNLVFGEGNEKADVLFIGEAPGYHEDKQKRPFVGRSGKLLDKFIDGVGWKREDVYITNIVKRRPPDNRDPLPEEIALYKPYLKRQIKAIDPKILAPLGRFATNYFLPDAKISRDQGKIFWIKNKMLIPIYHPAAALRSTKVMKDTKLAFRKLQKAAEKYEEIKNKKGN